MSSQRPWFTRVSDLVAVRSHEPTLSLHRGQLRLLCSNVPFRQRRQRLCVHGSVTGSIRIPRHTGHMRSRRFTSALSRDSDRSNNFDVRFKYVAIFPYSCYATIDDGTARHYHHHIAIPPFRQTRNARTRGTPKRNIPSSSCQSASNYPFDYRARIKPVLTCDNSENFKYYSKILSF